MGLVGQIAVSHARQANAISKDPLSDFWYQPAGWVTASGVRMSRDAALTISAFWNGVLRIGRSIAAVGCGVFQRLDNGGKQAVPPYAPGIGRLAIDLGRQPNQSQTAFDYFLMQVLHVVTRGVFVAKIQDKVDAYGQELIPLHPDRIRPGRVPAGTLVYDYTAPDGRSETYLQDEVHSVWGMTVDGVTPMSVIQYGARSIGATLAAEDSAASFFARGMTSQFAITYKPHVEPTTAKQTAQQIAGQNAGLKNGHAPIILGDDPKIWNDLGIKPQDAQLIDTRKFGVEDVARWLDMPKHMLKADQGTGSYASLEVLSAEFVTYCLLPWCVMIEQAIARDLLIAPDKYFVEFNLDKLMRGNLLDRMKAHQIGIFSGMETRNEGRLAEGRNPLPGLDAPLEPLNYQPVGDDTAPPTPRGPSSPSQPAQNGAIDRLQQRLGQLHLDIATRLVRREQHEVEKLAKKHASDAAGWAQAVPAFYAEFTTQIADGLRISKASAAEYAATHAMALVCGGIGIMASWDQDAPPALAARARQTIAA